MRNYGQFCGIAKALDVVGGRWSLLIVRELLLGPRRYSELQANLVGITPNLLADRLKELERAGVVQTGPVTPTSARKSWSLTDWGRELEPALLALGAFGARTMQSPVGHRTNGRWFAISLQRRYQGGMDRKTIALIIDGEHYVLSVSPDRLVSRDGEIDDADLSIRGSLPAVASALSPGGPRRGGAPGSITLEGDASLFTTLRHAVKPS